jgi:phosphatidylserine decarboxylase
MTLTRYGLREWLTITVVCVAVAATLGWFGWWWGLPVVLVVWLALVSFFRDPARQVPDNMPPEVLLSPADGTVSAVLEVDEHVATGGGPATIVRIFLSVLNVHVNRAPCAGEVVSLTATPGKYLNAQTEESARVNASNLVTMRVGSGDVIGVRQVTGMIARRIVCTLAVGQRVTRGERFGMIKFGSTAELILPRPDAVTVHVRPGERVVAGRTQLATFAPLKPAEVAAAPAAAAVEPKASPARVPS